MPRLIAEEDVVSMVKKEDRTTEEETVPRRGENMCYWQLSFQDKTGVYRYLSPVIMKMVKAYSGWYMGTLGTDLTGSGLQETKDVKVGSTTEKRVLLGEMDARALLNAITKVGCDALGKTMLRAAVLDISSVKRPHTPLLSLSCPSPTTYIVQRNICYRHPLPRPHTLPHTATVYHHTEPKSASMKPRLPSFQAQGMFENPLRRRRRGTNALRSITG